MKRAIWGDYHKLLIVLHHQRHIFAEQGKGRVCNDNIGLLQQRHAFTAAEITSAVFIIAFERP